MKSVKALKEIKHNWHEGSCSFAIESICDALIAITERLEAGVDLPCALEQTDDAIERRGMIKALRWVSDNTPNGPVQRYMADVIAEAITRLENGGDL